MLTLNTVIERNRRFFPDRPAVLDAEGVLDWAAFGNRIAQAAGLLAEIGIGRGDTFGILARNSRRHAELIYGASWLGAVAVPVNYRLAGAEIAAILDDAGCRHLFVDDMFAERLAAAELARWKDGALRIASEVLEYRLARAPLLPACDAGDNDDAILLYTGGTTGRPKGVPLSQHNVVVNAIQNALSVPVGGDDIYLHVAPMFHAADLVGNMVSLHAGAHVYVAEPSPAAILAAIARWRVTAVMLPPTLVVRLLQDPALAGTDVGSVRHFLYGSAPMDPAWTLRAMDRFPAAGFHQGYGLTETSPLLTMLGDGDHRRARRSGCHDILRSVGRPVVGVELRIVDEAGRDVPRGTVGEVVARGPNIVRDYRNRPEDSARGFRGGWFHTGDHGRLGQDGLLYLAGRESDRIISGGENVYPSEVETVLLGHHAVADAAVFGACDPVLGETVCAAIVAAPGMAVGEDEIVAHCRRHIGGYKIPRILLFVEGLPRTAVGKVRRDELRRLAEEKSGRR